MVGLADQRCASVPVDPPYSLRNRSSLQKAIAVAAKVELAPVTRIEGHLSIQTEAEPVERSSGKRVFRILRAKCQGEMFRGFETLLQGREPLDAQQIVQRICGVCPIPHGLASIRAQEMAYGIQPSPNGRLLQNLILAADMLQSHILHFYQFAAPDFADVALPGAPLQPRFDANRLELLAPGRRRPAGARRKGPRRTRSRRPGAAGGGRPRGPLVRSVHGVCGALRERGHYNPARPRARLAAVASFPFPGSRLGETPMLRRHWLIALGIWAVLAAGAMAAPKYKALVVDGQNGHKWQETTPALKSLLEETGLFTVDVATSPPKGQDMSGFKPNFAAYKLVVLNYQGDDWPADTQKAFVDYVNSGGGVVVFHFACAAFPKWKEYNEIIGLGGWGARGPDAGVYVRWCDGKIVRQTTARIEKEGTVIINGKKTRVRGMAGSHGPMQEFQVVVRDANHPVTKGLPSAFMQCPDELYGWLRGPAKNLTVLATAFAPKEKGGADEHEPILFTVQYGQGRVFFNAMGHTAKELKSVAFIATYQRGAEWAVTGQVTQKVPADFPGPDKASMRE